MGGYFILNVQSTEKNRGETQYIILRAKSLMRKNTIYRNQSMQGLPNLCLHIKLLIFFSFNFIFFSVVFSSNIKLDM